jgi:hypothetical protein
LDILAREYDMDVTQLYQSKRTEGNEATYRWLIEMALESPDQILKLLLFVIERDIMHPTTFNDLCRYLPDSDYPELINASLRILKGDIDHVLAHNIINSAAFQALPHLHPHLDDLFGLLLNRRDYIRNFPWRDSGLLHFEFLLGILRGDGNRNVRLSAFEKLLELRIPEAFSVTREAVSGFGLNWTRYLAYVGFIQEADHWLPLFSPTTRHIIYPEEELERWERPFHLKSHHITWHLPASDETTHRFGGTHDNVCVYCKNPLHHLITLTPIPDFLNIAGLNSLTIATCLSCLVWKMVKLFYKHDEQGQPEHIGQDIVHTEPLEVLPPITEMSVHLADAGERWRWQDWAKANSRENLHRVGGFPCWIQGPDYTVCPECNSQMRFILQLDDNFPACDYWQGGMLYVCWCDSCRVSSLFWQST